MVTGEMVEELILAGADIIKVGIGPGDHSVTHSSASMQKLITSSLRADVNHFLYFVTILNNT